MKPRGLLLCVCFITFYLFTQVAWQTGQYLSDGRFFSHLTSMRAYIVEISNLGTFLLYSILAYFTFYILYYRHQHKTGAILLYIFVAVPVMICLRYIIEEIIVYHLIGRHNYSDSMRQPLRYFIDNIYFANYYSACGIVFFFVQLSGYNQQKQQALLIQSRNAELSFLRSQINPHFLFNSLNNIYALVYKQSGNALTVISKLSDLLRYMLYEKEELVPLEKEIQYLQSLVDMQLIRYDFPAFTSIDIQVPEHCSFLISPFTLITFVENAFKHGDLRDAEYPLTIRLLVKGNHLYFFVSNRTGSFTKDQTGGIGLDNVRKRLELVYGSDHYLQVTNEKNIFTVNLTIQLHGR